MLAQIKKHRSFRNVFCLLFVLISLGVGNFSDVSFAGVLRAFSGMISGLLMFDFIEALKKKRLKKSSVVFFYLAFFASIIYIAIILLQRTNLISAYPQIAYCMILAQFIILTTIFSEKTIFSSIKCNFFNLLGNISLPMFLVHESIAKILYKLKLGIDDTIMLVIYLFAIIVISSLIYIIVNYTKKSLKSRLSEQK
jgi:peptidoglycan/LPS O-acetylase OafA/YrhL